VARIGPAAGKMAEVPHMNINSHLFEAFLKCPTKCWLRSQGEVGGGNDYAAWVQSQNEIYRNDGVRCLTEGTPPSECIIAPSVADSLKSAKWHFAVDVLAQAQTLESRLHAVERLPSEGRGKPAQFIPVRFVFTNKLSKDDKLLLAFDALVLSGVLGRELRLGRIIHGDDHASLKVKLATLMSQVRNRVEKMHTLLSNSSAPDLLLNRHCTECEFQMQCRQKAIEKDDLSLLANMTEKERKKYHSKGIFTVTQLSYTFRPRRRPRRMRDKRERYHHSLKALAIREKKIHIVGSPELKISGTPLYLDVEGLPDRDFYYLIGVRIRHGDSIVQHSLWADSPEDETVIWSEFLGMLATVENPVLVHYGGFEATFMRRMCQQYGGPPHDSPPDKAVESSTNLLSVIFSQFYFPTYSNGLKDVAKCLNFHWSDLMASGARSVAVRYEWEQSRDPTAKEWLVRYNAEDCEALEIVASALLQTCGPKAQPGVNESNLSDMVNVESLRRQMPSYFDRKKSVTADLEFLRKAAYWNYQRDRLYFRSAGQRSRKPRKVIVGCNTTSLRINKVVVHDVSPECPTCKRISSGPKATRVRILYDLCFGRFSIKRWVVKHVYQTYYCWRCELYFGLEKRFKRRLKFGWNLVAYFLYQVIQLRISQRIVTLSMNELFGLNLKCVTTHQFKSRAAEFYKETQRQILARLVKGDLIHADETKANVKGQLAYVWVFTNLREVVYLYADTREADMLHATLAGFKGVLVSDFYAAYDSLDCPQQKCLTHLLRDLNDEVLDHPYDEELKELVKNFGSLVRPMVETVDQHGLKRHFLRKHHRFVDRFYRELGKTVYRSEAARKCKDRFEKNRNKLFTFLDYDGIPWNNNNAEHAIKAYAALRNVMEGTSTQVGIEQYLILLSICETCEYQGSSFLEFLRSGEKDVYAFAESRRKRKTRACREPTGL
jgi:predicted RecB family nuclease